MRCTRRAAALLLSLLLPSPCLGWGLSTHRWVEEQAIETLPEPLRHALRAHVRQISDWSVEPDTVLRERYGAREAVKHFIDLDRYGRPPFAELPRGYRAAVRRYGKEMVEASGTVPWTIEDEHARMVRELRAGEWAKALKTAAYAGHYVADATMPLHTVSDYDGQAAGSPGIHKAVEHALVDERLAEYAARVRAHARPVRAEDYDADAIFAVLFESYAAVPALLSADRAARRAGPVGSARYVAALDRGAGSLLAARLARAVQLLGAFWLSAWEEAGRPKIGYVAAS